MINSVVAFKWLNMLIAIAFFGRLAYRYIILPIITDQKNDSDTKQQRLDELKNSELEVDELRRAVNKDQRESEHLRAKVKEWSLIRDQEQEYARAQFELRLKSYQEKLDRRFMLKQERLILAHTIEKAIAEAKSKLEDEYRDSEKGYAYIDALLKAGINNETRA